MRTIRVTTANCFFLGHTVQYPSSNQQGVPNPVKYAQVVKNMSYLDRTVSRVSQKKEKTVVEVRKINE